MQGFQGSLLFTILTVQGEEPHHSLARVAILTQPSRVHTVSVKALLSALHLYQLGPNINRLLARKRKQGQKMKAMKRIRGMCM